MSRVNRLDIIVFGASGFTGKPTVYKLLELLKVENLSLKWGIAGRSKEKLENLLSEIHDKTGEDYSNVPIIYAEINDRESIEKMTSQASVIINAAGPYRIFGERVIQACIKTRTHHVDISGEIQYMESMQLKYHDQARESGIYLISACGVESIPADLGVIFLQKNFKGTLNSVEAYVTLKEEGGYSPGSLVHYGSYESGVSMYLHREELKNIRSKLFPEPLDEFTPKLKHRGLFFKNKFLNKWCTIFPSPDKSVVLRTQRYLYETKEQRPVQMNIYFCYDNFLQVILIGVMALTFMLMCMFSFTQKVLLKYPKLFTLGLISHEGPSQDKQERTLFDMILVGKGWSEELANTHNRQPSKKITARIFCKNPVYGSTCILFALSAIMILQEKNKMPKGGGCFPPGVAFANTSMIEKLNRYGVKFELNPAL